MLLVCPMLEYATQVWDPYQKSLTQIIQRRDFFKLYSSVSNMLAGPHLKEDREKVDHHFYLELLTIKNQL